METIHNQVSAAKEIKKILSKKWPSVKFSVKSDSYSMGCSIDVNYSMGPKISDVEKIADRYQYGSFDGMTDCYNYDPTLILTDKNEIKQLGGAKYVHCQRDYPQDLKVKFCQDLCKLQKVEYKGEDTNIFGNSWNYDQTASSYFWKVFCQTDFTNAVYDGVEVDDSNDRVSFVRIKTKPITKQELEAIESEENVKKQAAKQKEDEKKAKSEAMYKEIREYYLKQLQEKPEANLWNGGCGWSGWNKAQAAGRVLSQLEKEGVLAIAYISTSGKKVYKKAVKS